MKDFFTPQTNGRQFMYLMVCLFSFLTFETTAQCTIENGTIKGYVYLDSNNDGIKDINESGLGGVIVSAYDKTGFIKSASSSSNGTFNISGLTDNSKYRIEYSYQGNYKPSFLGSSNGSSVQFVGSPSCNANLGLINLNALCGTNPELLTTCFVQGPTSNSTLETIIGFEHNFNSGTKAKKYATHAETGSVWGIAWKSTTNEIFSSAFVKQYSGLTSNGPGAIIKTKIQGSTNTTKLYVDLAKTINVGTLSVTDISDCDYGNNVGRVGLGALVIDPTNEYLYVTNLGNRSLVRVSTTDPSDVTEYSIPNPGCSDGEYRPFALKFKNDKLYIGVTCTAETARLESSSKAIVYEWNPANAAGFSNIFETAYIKGYWHDSPPSSLKVSHWFTDIDFTDDGNMVIGLSDRKGHRYCKNPNNRLDNQQPDILMVYKDKNGKWTLESNGKAGTLTGSGVGNSQGPGGGEFFGEDAFPAGPGFHPEVAIGSFFILPGTNSVVAAAFDPEGNTTSGGFHKYSTTNGKRLSTVELYTRNSSELFGKATGFGDVIAKCGAPSIEIGNFVWNDANNNGLQDADEDPIQGLTLNLLDSDCNIVATSTTDQYGNYKFSDIVSEKEYYISIPIGAFDQDYGILTINGQEYSFTISGTSNENIDNNASILDVDCDNVIIPINTDVTNHTFDIGLVKPAGFDLALKKELLSSNIAHLNEVIPFKITIFNQGGIVAKNITIKDYIPSGYEFNVLDNPSWQYDGSNATTTLPGTLIPGASTYTIIRLKIINTNVANLVNVAEIISATDLNDNPVNDEDSVMDDDNTNDKGGDVGTDTDDLYTDDGTIDEDDSDPAVPYIFDLALKQYYDDNNCITGGSQIVVKICVFNQGNVPSKSFAVANYGAPNLVFNKSYNPAWKLIDGKIVYEGGAIAPGGKVTLDLKFDVINLSQNIEVVNYAEIISSIPEGSSISDDSDSTPDDIEDNDKGGRPNTSDDNNIDGTPDVDEDDHDPIVINSRTVDLALILTTEARLIQTGDEVCFKVKVFNQGFMPISQITIANYLPEELIMNPGQGWKAYSGNNYKKVINFNNSFAHKDTYEEEICVTVGDISGKSAIENYAEISNIIGMCGEDLSLKDIDSQADDEQYNDAGGRPLTNTDDSIDELPSIDEDDHDPALLINVSTSIPPVSSCEYQNDATEPGNGMIGSTVQLKSPANMVWTLDQAVGYFDPASSAGTLINFPPGTTMSVLSTTNGESTYVLNGEFVSGKSYNLRFVSDNNDYAYVNSGPVCSYKSATIDGPVALCTDGVATYSVLDANNGDWDATVTGGAITQTSNQGRTIVVNWIGAGQKEIRFEHATDLTYEPVVLKVVTGSADNAMKCRANSNLSLDADCSVEILPSHISLGTPNPNAAYIIMSNLNGVAIPGNIVDASYLGKTIEVKLIEGCGGNSCWGRILIEDKMAPTILCDKDITVSCYKVDQYRGPVAQDNCGEPIKLNILDSLYTPIMCQGVISGTFYKKYQAVDSYGNKSAICEQTIQIEKVRLDSIKFPANFKMADALDCKGFEEDGNGYPIPSLTGFPTLEGDAIYPEFDKFCNLYVTYEDEGNYPFECATKFIRKWTVWDLSCVSNPTKTSKEQTVIFGDKSAPTFNCPTSFEASAGYTNCEAKVKLLPATEFADDCSTTFKVDMKYPGGFKYGQNGNFDVFLPVGINTITYRVYDDCKRSNECSYTITVSDKTAPLAICDKNTTVSLLPTGDVYMFAKTIDDGSWDACGIVSFEGRRIDQSPNGAFADIIEFDCDDVDAKVPVIVELKVTDANKNSNTCMVNVFVQDKTKPVIVCPDSIIITCMDHYDLNDLSQFGSITVTDECQNAMDTTETIINMVDQCRVGFIDRIFEVSDGSNVASCTQRIRVINPITFNIDDHVIRPLDYEVENMCGASSLHPDSLPIQNGWPIIDEGICDLVAPGYKDKRYVFDTGDGTCFKIIRRWTIINYCKKTGDKFDEISFDQVLKVRNLNPPIVTIKDSTFIKAPLNKNDCEMGAIVLEASAEDSCKMNDDLYWTYQIFLEGETTPIQLSGNGPSAKINRDFPLGDHYVLWSFEDMCGNVATERQDFKIFDNNKPTCVVLDTVAIGLVPMDLDDIPGVDTEMACITPDSLDVSSSHPCVDNSDLIFSFSSDGMLNELCFDCFNVGLDSFSIFVIDPSGNFDKCVVKILVQDNNNVDLCPFLEECIVWPQPLNELITCSADTSASPAGLGIATVADTCACLQYNISYIDTQINNLATCKAFDRDWTVTFTCGIVRVYKFKQEVFIKNDVAPNITCPKNITIDANTNCMADVILSDAFATDDNCNTDVSITNDSGFATNPNENASGTYPVGDYTVVFTVSDACNNTNTCSTSILIVDNSVPIANCNDITVSLLSDGTYTLSQADQDIISAGSGDNCTFDVTISPLDFDCDNVGPNTVLVSVTDGSQTAMCNATVTVEDNIPPTVMCNPLSVALIGNTITLTQAQINSIGLGSSDNCEELTFTLLNPTFDCDDVNSTVTRVLTVSDDTGNMSTCTATITVLDQENPVAVCVDLIVNLSSTNGTVTLSAAQINGLGLGSSDNCSFVITASPTSFTCANVGPNDVTVTVTDPSNNTDQCTAEVTVQDNTPPIAVCSDITITLNAMNMYMLTANDLATITAGSSDNCSYVPSSTAMFDCSDIGLPVDVTITLTDPSNNTTTCDIEVTVTEGNTPTLTCSDITVYLDANGVYSLSSMDSMGMVMQSTGSCGTSITFSQSTFGCTDIPSVDVLISLFDVLGALIDTCTSTVTIIDTLVPTAICADITVSLDATGNYVLSPADIDNIDNNSNDACGIFAIEVTPDSFTCGEIGGNTVILTVTDNNTNTSTCTATLTVEDNQTIFAMCNDITVNVMQGQIYELTPVDSAAVILGSFDNCNYTVEFWPAEFSCADVPNSPIQMAVDFYNSVGIIETSCFANVTILSMDTLMCLTQDITIYLDSLGEVSITPQDIDNGSGGGCDASVMFDIDIEDFTCNDFITNPTIVTLTVFTTNDTLTCTAQVTVLDTIAPIIFGCQSLIEVACDTFDGNFGAIMVFDSIWDNCTAYTINTDTLNNSFNNCGQGVFIRNIIVTDNISGLKDTCNNTISIIGTSTPLVLGDFSLPVDTIINNCSAYDTSITGIVTFNGALPTCSFVEISFSDNPNAPAGMCTDTILRTWTMLDTCNANTLTYTQTITIIDTLAPMLSAVDTVFIANPNNECSLIVDLSGIVTNTDCGSTNITETNDSPFSDNPNSIDASGEYPFGTHVITVTAADGCGNTDTLSYVLVIEDATYIFGCVKIIANLGPDTMACVAVTDVASVTGLCDTGFTIVLVDDITGIEYPQGDTIKFDCADLGDKVFYVYLYQGTTLIDSCTERSSGGRTIITITDVNGLCTGPISRITGSIKTNNNQVLENVYVALEGSEMYEMTNKDGNYAFPEMPSGGNYMLKPRKDDGLLAGVSTLDLILIQRHILKIESLHNNYDLIAADVNNDNKVTASDLVELRKAILGLSNSFKNNTSWKMVDAGYQFPVNMDPFAERYPIEYELSPLKGRKIIDFVGVKIGDVNGSFVSNARSNESESRSVNTILLQDEFSEANTTNTLMFDINGLDKMFGLQFGLEIDGLSEIVSVTAGTTVDLDYNVIGQTLYISLSDREAIDVADLNLQVVFKTNKTARLSGLISLSENHLDNEIYDNNLNRSKLVLDWKGVQVANFEFSQNTPNPWKDKTYLEFMMPNDQEVFITITDISGKVIHNRKVNSNRGLNTIEIKDRDVDMMSGVFIITLDIGGTRLQQKMIRLN